jgi:hypothetical protein
MPICWRGMACEVTSIFLWADDTRYIFYIEVWLFLHVLRCIIIMSSLALNNRSCLHLRNQGKEKRSVDFGRGHIHINDMGREATRASSLDRLIW